MYSVLTQVLLEPDHVSLRDRCANFIIQLVGKRVVYNPPPLPYGCEFPYVDMRDERVTRTWLEVDLPKLPELPSWRLMAGCIVAVPTLVALARYFGVDRYVARKFHHTVDRYLRWTNRITADYQPVRSIFQQSVPPKSKLPANHTHASAAADRTKSLTFCEELALRLGRRLFSIQQSRNDQKNQRAGNRYFYFDKDFTTSPVNDEPLSSDLMCYIDVDYYLDMHDYMSRYPLPTFMYTFQPTKAADNCPENFSFTFNDDNTVSYNVAGGASYKHHVWDYQGDVLSVSSTMFGLPYTTTTYLIDRQPGDAPHHSMVFLTPLSHHVGFVNTYLAQLLQQHPLNRFLPVNNGYARFHVRTKTEHYVTTAAIGQYVSATVPVETDNTISNLSELGKLPLTNPTVSGLLPAPEDDDDARLQHKSTAAILTSYHREQHDEKPLFVCPTEASVERVQHGKFDPDAKPTMHAFMTPFILGKTYTFDKTPGNEAQAVSGRVVAVGSRVKPTNMMITCIEEFASFFVPPHAAHTLRPYTYEQVRDKQSRPTQRRILDDTENDELFSNNTISTFIKAEPYQKVTDPRIISTIPGPTKRDYSAYTYALSDYMCTNFSSWYAFGKTPRHNAERVAGICQNAHGSIVSSDFTRLDGSLTDPFRILEQAVLNRAFPEADLRNVSDLHLMTINQRARCTLGTSYNTGMGRLSGSPDTSLFNTLDNVFTVYYSLRRTMIDEESSCDYYSPQQAWNYILRNGTYGGDDGLTADLDPLLYTQHCAELGLVVKAQPIPKGSFGVTFLSRVYGPNVWYGSPNSTCDLIRQLSKFHLSNTWVSGQDPTVPLLEKALAYLLTDANTPYIGDYCRAVVNMFHIRPKYHNVKPVGYWLDHALEDQYPNELEEWMYTYAQSVIEFPLDKFVEIYSSLTVSELALLSPPVLADFTPAALPADCTSGTRTTVDLSTTDAPVFTKKKANPRELRPHSQRRVRNSPATQPNDVPPRRAGSRKAGEARPTTASSGA